MILFPPSVLASPFFILSSMAVDSESVKGGIPVFVLQKSCFVALSTCMSLFSYVLHPFSALTSPYSTSTSTPFWQVPSRNVYCCFQISSLWLDLIIFDRKKNIFIIELTVGHESSLNQTKARKYKNLLSDKKITVAYRKVNDLAMTAEGICSTYADFFLAMLEKFDVDSSTTMYITAKLSEICIGYSYLIFCMRAKQWPDNNYR